MLRPVGKPGAPRLPPPRWLGVTRLPHSPSVGFYWSAQKCISGEAERKETAPLASQWVHCGAHPCEGQQTAVSEAEYIFLGLRRCTHTRPLAAWATPHSSGGGGAAAAQDSESGAGTEQCPQPSARSPTSPGRGEGSGRLVGAANPAGSQPGPRHARTRPGRGRDQGAAPRPLRPPARQPARGSWPRAPPCSPVCC